MFFSFSFGNLFQSPVTIEIISKLDCINFLSIVFKLINLISQNRQSPIKHIVFINRFPSKLKFHMLILFLLLTFFKYFHKVFEKLCILWIDVLSYDMVNYFMLLKFGNDFMLVFDNFLECFLIDSL